MPDTDERISIREFGRYIGLSDTAIKKQMFDPINKPDGPLKDSICKNEANGRPMLYKTKALAEWVAAGLTIKNQSTLDMVTIAVHTETIPLQANKPPDTGPPQQPAVSTPAQNIKRNENGNVISEDISSYEAKRYKEVFAAGKAEIEYRKMLGELVEKKQVYAMLFEFGQEIRSALVQIPARIIPHIIAADSEAEGREILMKEIEIVLLKLSEGPKENKNELDEESSDNAAA